MQLSTGRFIKSLVVIVIAVFGMLNSAKAGPVVIDFDGLALAEGSAVPAINGVTFDASVVIQGGSGPSLFAFNGPTGGDTGLTAPFNTPGNIFITNPGGFATAETVKQLTITFPEAVQSVSFLAADIDAGSADGGFVIERLTAEARDGMGNVLSVRTITASTSDPFDNGVVHLVDFGTTTGIEQLVLRLDNAGTPANFTQLGFGVDNLTYSAAPVPEPSSLFLFGIGFASLCGGSLWRNRAAIS